MKDEGWLYRWNERLAAFLFAIFPWQVQLGLIAVGFAAVVGSWLFVIYLDNVWSAANPAYAGGGMAAFSESLYHLFHACMFMVPACWLIWLLSRFDAVYAVYARFLFWLSVTLPLLLAVCFAGPLGRHFLDALLIRLLVSPFVLVGMAFSRLMARFRLARKRTLAALLIEGATLGAALALFYAGVL